MVVYTLEQRWKILRHYFRRFWQKKIIFSDETHFDLAGYVSKIVAFEAQKTRTHSLKSRRSHNESLFGADFVPEANWAIFLRKWTRRGRYSQWQSLSGHIEWIFVEEEDIGNIWLQQDGAKCLNSAYKELLRIVQNAQINS